MNLARAYTVVNNRHERGSANQQKRLKHGHVEGEIRPYYAKVHAAFSDLSQLFQSIGSRLSAMLVEDDALSQLRRR